MIAPPEIAAPEATHDSASGDRCNPRLDRFAKATIIALILAFSLAVVAGSGLSESSEDVVAGDRLGGDYPAFHAAGAIILSGDIDELYDADRQQAEQAGLGIDGYLAFAYPPHVAVVYAPLASLGFRMGYAVHTILMAAALVAALRLLGGPVPIIARYRWPAAAAALAFFPMFRAIGGGQNTALTVLIFAAFWRALHDDRDDLAGIAAGVMMFRPQYGLPLIGLLIVARRWRGAVAAGATCAATWFGVATFMGAGWVQSWIDQVLPFVEHDAEVNAENSISLVGFIQAVFGKGHSVAVIAGTLGAAIVVGTLIWMWWHPSRFTLSSRMGATAVGVLLISPHTMFYDAGLLIVAAVAFLAENPDENGAFRILGIVWLTGFVHLLAPALGATPLALVTLGVFAAMVWHSHQPATEPRFVT